MKGTEIAFKKSVNAYTANSNRLKSKRLSAHTY